ncbi:AAA family ATPase [Nocardioides daphniae]|uniref:AAA+ ATPase domain-containing protein n=1 Tax=Nocardioides daphniae TaxID=402297 RepID=A0A4V1CWJ6_9ACTN|nr:AAA family ATPase [Nocardioides daphniae]QCC77497.1 hypothetical protein E2C04_10495 [Nocardioides daphniae]GGD31412.1 hypothetical protein GCM10007231_33720 [Nocardioides daphniae]
MYEHNPPPTPQRLHALSLTQWRQFEDLELDLSHRVTILTGENGTGKTTLLKLIGKHFQAPSSFIASPRREADGTMSWLADPDSRSNERSVGTFTYGTESGQLISAPAFIHSAGVNHNANVPALLPGIFIASHSRVGAHHGYGAIPLTFPSTSEILERGRGAAAVLLAGDSYGGPTIQSTIKETLISAAILGYGNQAMQPDPRALDIWVNFQEVLRSLLPSTLGFKQLAIALPELMIERDEGEAFLLEASSGGITKLIEIGWLLYLQSLETPEFTVCIDEPENHLHPSLQRTLLPGLLRAFPGARFIVATHSPFVVTASPDGHVYALEYEEGSVQARSLDFRGKAASADATLRRVLGVQSTMPVWVEQRLSEALNRAATQGSTQSLLSLHRQMNELGLNDEFPATLESLKEIAEARDEED